MVCLLLRTNVFLEMPPILKPKPRLCSHDGSKEYLLACLEDVSCEHILQNEACKRWPSPTCECFEFNMKVATFHRVPSSL